MYHNKTEKEVIDILRDFEAKHGQILMHVEKLLEKVDDVRDSTGTPQSQSVYTLRNNPYNESPELKKILGDYQLVHHLPTVLPHFGVLIIDGLNMRGAHFMPERYVLETQDHLFRLPNRNLRPSQLIHLNDLWEKYLNMTIPNLPVIGDPTDADHETAVQNALYRLASKHPAILAKIFNESLSDLGFVEPHHHVKRSLVLAKASEVLNQ